MSKSGEILCDVCHRPFPNIRANGGIECHHDGTYTPLTSMGERIEDVVKGVRERALTEGHCAGTATANKAVAKDLLALAFKLDPDLEDRLRWGAEEDDA